MVGVPVRRKELLMHSAKLQVGDIVLVTNICDDEGLTKEMLRQRGPNPGLGREALVIGVHTKDEGIGESEEHPFLSLRFDDGYENGYWPEELQYVRRLPDRASLPLIEMVMKDHPAMWMKMRQIKSELERRFRFLRPENSLRRDLCLDIRDNPGTRFERKGFGLYGLKDILRDSLHPNGRCSCEGEGRCNWCQQWGDDD